ncbi:MAG: type III pantothenate kinase [Akkermansia sp.]
MRTLLIDNSNGRTKCVPCEGGGLLAAPRVIPTGELSEGAWEQLTADWHCGSALLSSVVPAAAAFFDAFYRKRGVELRRVSAQGQGLVSFDSYAGLATLGDDRMVNALAAVVGGLQRPTIVIDAGTATTFDMVMPGSPPRFVGGAIAPGLGLLARSLHHATAALPMPELELPKFAIGSDTTAALQSGVVLGYQGLARGLISAMEQEVGGVRAAIVLTGGDAALLARLLGRSVVAEPLLTLRGLACYASQEPSGQKK